LPVLYALFLWWFSTGVVFYLDGLPKRTFPWSMIGATGVLVAALAGLAAAADDTTVGGAYLSFSCGLLAWVWDPAEQAVTDPNAASDGDLLVAWATLRAADKWDAPELRAEALAHLEALVAETVIETRFGPTLLPGPFGFEAEGGPVLNPSYWVFPALAEIGEATGDPVWSGLIDSGLALLDEARFGRFNLTGDWVKASLPPGLPEDFPPVFGFNAIRVPMHLVWARRVPGVAERLEDHLAPYRQFWSLFDGAGTIPATVDLATGEFADYGLSPGGRAITVITRFAGRSEYAWALLPRLGPDQPYFSASLLLLSKLALLEGDA
ncbi:MAG: DUF3623 family protein, partial [Alphaproteobacteria bacterium]|nr:DUF3623 family protein [Alphaproteobacteria bacterium]